MIKDLTTKRCLSDNERYADLINGAVFGGRQLLKPQDLTDRDSQAMMRRRKAAGKKKSRKPLYRDLVKKATFGVNFAVISLEDQDKLLTLVQSDPAYQELDEAAYDMVSEYVNEEGLIEIKKYQGTGGKVNMCKALEDMRAESREEGRQEGRQEGIGVFIETYQEFQVSKEETIVKLCEKFNLSRERAEDCVQKYWK